MKKALGANGFSKDYWDKNYSEAQTMDGVGNAKDHVKYIRSLFHLDQIDISSIVDLGFGPGKLFGALLKEFLPYRACGIEPSDYAFQKFSRRKVKPVNSMHLTLEHIDIVSWCQKMEGSKKAKWFDLGVCTSVFQYLSEDEIDYVVGVLSKYIKYLYFSVPTDTELKRQVRDLEFCDEYAIARPRSFYQEKLRPHFSIVSARMLESKVHFDEDSTFFTDLLFRY